MRSGLAQGLIFAFSTIIAQSSSAAEVTLGGDLDVQCKATISGQIHRGDAERVIDFLRANDLIFRDGPICLEGPGGFWAEAITLMQFFYENAISTAVTAGAECLSACAVAFLGGTHQGMSVIPSQARSLHVRGHLGFHAPFLEDIPRGQYDAQIVEEAWNKAMQSVVDLTAWSDRLSLSDDFLVNMFSTSPSDMFMIDTVGKALDLSINLLGYEPPSDLSDAMIEDACRRSWDPFEPGSQRFDSGAWVEGASRIADDQNLAQRGVALVVFGQESYSFWHVCAVTYYGTVPNAVRPSLEPYDILFASVSEDPVLELADVEDAPMPSLYLILSVAEDLFQNTNLDDLVHMEEVLPPTELIERLQIAATPPEPTNGAQSSEGALTRTSAMPAFPVPRAVPPLEAPRTGSDPGNRYLQFASFWDHNGSRMGLVANGASRSYYYVQPRAAIAARGVRPDTLLFEGQRVGNRYEGIARIFAQPPCGTSTYRVAGPVSADQRTVTLYGRTPRVNDRCEITGYRDDTLVFTLE